MVDQIKYLEDLLKGYRERYAKGEKTLETQIKITAAKLEEEKLKQKYEKPKDKPKLPLLSYVRRGCCRG